MSGRLIAIEGIDGSGKRTQAQQLVIHLQQQGLDAVLYSFPDYDNTFYGREIGAFLRGDFGSLDQVHPKLAALLFAGDRLEHKTALLADLARGAYVVCDRYVDSNIAHQAAKLPADAIAEFVHWVQHLEYQVNGLPRPECTVFLDVPLPLSTQLVRAKQTRSYTEQVEDLHEADHAYLAQVQALYRQLVQPPLWQAIDCAPNAQLLPAQTIAQQVLDAVLSPAA